MSELLRFDHVSKWYGQVSALIEVSASIEPGVTGLVGENGAGKTTLLKLACGLLRPSTGSVQVCGKPPSEPATRRDLGFCPDIDRYYEKLSGRKFVTWMLRLQGIARRDASTRAGEILEQLGLGDAMERPITGYSKGMRQRVGLAQALAHDPKVVILDEPLTGLDPIARHDIVELVRGLGRRGVAVLVSSHVLHELQNVADRFLLMHHGRLMAEGTLRDLRDQLEDRPRKLTLSSGNPRVLASRLSSLEQVEGLRIGDGTVIVETQGAGLFEALTEIGAQQEGLLREVAVLDDSLEAVFGYLVP